MCSCETTAIFAWIGFIIVNTAFLGIIFWGNATAWPLGLVLILVYAAALLAAVFYLEKRIDTEDEIADQIVDDQFSVNNDHRTLGSVVTVLYLLFVFAIGTAGAFLAFNLLQCPESSYTLSGEWVVNDDVSSDVKEFANTPFSRNYPGFTHFPSSGVTWFESYINEKQDDYVSPVQYMMAVSKDKLPEIFIENPRYLTELNQGLTCMYSQSYEEVSSVYCSSDGINIQTVFNVSESISSINGLYVSPSLENMLWISAYNNEPYGNVIYSVDTATTVSSLRSKFVKEGSSNSSNANDDCEEDERKIALMTLFLSCIPVVLISSFLYQKRSFVPSMVLSLYVGLTGVVVTIYVSVVPDDIKNLYDVLRWWFTLSGLSMLFFISYLSLTQKVTPAVMSWGLFTSGVCYFAGTMMVIEILSNYGENSDWWRWVLINVVTFIPLIVVGVMLGQMFLIALGAIGLMMDVFRFSVQVGTWMGDSGAYAIVQFVVLAIFGVIFLGLGIFVQKNTANIKKNVDKWVESNLGSNGKSGTGGKVEAEENASISSGLEQFEA